MVFGLIIGGLAGYAMTGTLQGACGGAAIGGVLLWLIAQLE